MNGDDLNLIFILLLQVEETPQELVWNWSSTQKGQIPYIVVKLP